MDLKKGEEITKCLLKFLKEEKSLQPETVGYFIKSIIQLKEEANSQHTSNMFWETLEKECEAIKEKYNYQEEDKN